MCHFLKTAVFLLGALLFSAVHAQNYQYDAAGRLVAAMYSDGSGFRYNYDANGNVTRIQHLASPAALLPPDGVIDTPSDDVSIDAGESVNFSGTGTDPDGATPLTFRWTFDGAAADSNDEDPGDIAFATAGTYDVEFLVTDATGLTDPTPATVTVTVNAVTPPPTGGGGGDNGGGGGGGGGGAASWLLLLLLLVRRVRAVLGYAAVLLLAAQALAAEWTPMSSPVTASLNAAWAAAADDVWVVGSGGTVLRYDGTAWQEETFTGTTLNLSGIWGSGPDNIYVVGDDGYVAHFDGAGWDIVDIGAGTMDLVDVWSAGPGEPVYVIGLQGAWELSGGSWTRRAFRPLAGGATLTPQAILTGIGGTANYVVITSRMGGVGANSGGFFVNFDEIEDWELYDVWAMSPTEMFAVGAESRRLNGDASNFGDWQPISVMPDARGVWGTGPDNVFAVGNFSQYAQIKHYDGNADNTWTTEVQLVYQAFNDVDGAGNTAYAVGNNGIIYHYFEPEAARSAANFPYAGNLAGGVHALTGELTHAVTDFTIGQVFPLVFERYYASGLGDRAVGGRFLGRNWTHSFEWRIDTAYGGDPAAVRVVDPRGREYLFLDDGSGWQLEEPLWAAAALTEANGNFLFVERDSERIIALSASDGRVQYIENRNGNRHTFHYISGFLSAIIDDDGNRVVFEYDASGRLGAAYLPGSGGPNGRGLEVQYDYQGGVLTSVTSPGGIVTEYDYIAGREGEARMVARWHGGELEMRWIYDSDNRVGRMLLTDGGEYAYAYDGTTATVTLPDGATTRALIHDENGALVSEQDGLGGTDTYEYDAWGRRSAWTDRAGRRTEWTYHLASGKLTRVVQPGGYTWNLGMAPGSSAAGIGFHDVIRIEYPDSGVVDYEFDGLGNITAFEDQEDNRWRYVYDTDGALVEAINPLGGTTRYARTAQGYLDTITNPAGNAVDVSYDEFGRLVQIRYPDDAIVLIYWDDRTSPVRFEYETGAITEITYDAAGRVSGVSRSDGTFGEYVWTPDDKLQSITRPGNRVTAYAYDPFRRIASVSKPLGGAQQFSYDVAGQLTSYIDGEDITWGILYDPDGFPRSVSVLGASVIDLDNSADARGLLTSISDGGNSMQMSWDAVSQLASISDPMERVTNVQRDLRGLVTSRTLQPADLTTRYARNALGDVTETTDPAGGTWQRSYDEAGRLASTTDPLGQSSTFAYDNRDRVSTVTRADGSTVTYTYDRTNGIANAQYSDGTEIATDRSPYGRVMGGDNLVLGYWATGKLANSNGIDIRYDDNDRLAGITFEAGRDLSYAYDDRGVLRSITDWSGGTSVFEADARRQVSSIALPNGITTAFARDRAGRIESITYGGIGSIVLNRGVFGRVESATRDLPGPRSIAAVDRRFSFDQAAQIESFEYDARGNLTRDASRNYQYDGANRLRAYDGDDGSVRLTYDALGHIVASDGPLVDRQYTQNYVYGQARVAIEKNGAGEPVWYYVYSDKGNLLYRINPDGQRQFYHVDENGNTVFMTDDSGSVIATYFYSPLGEVVDESGNLGNDRKARAEFGGRELEGTTTLSLGLTYADPQTGHGLTRFDAPVTEEQAPEDDEGFAAPHVRLPSAPSTAVKPPPFNAKDVLDAAEQPAAPRARPLSPFAQDPVVRWVELMRASQMLRLIQGALPPVPGRLVEAPRAEAPQADDEEPANDRPVHYLPWLPSPVDSIRPPGFLPESERPEPVDSILKDVGGKLVPL